MVVFNQQTSVMPKYTVLYINHKGVSRELCFA